MGQVAIFWTLMAIIISVGTWFEKHGSKFLTGLCMIFIVIFMIVAFPFILIRDFIYRVILDRTVYTGWTFLKPRNAKERRIKAWIERSRKKKAKEKAREKARAEQKKRNEENLRLMQEDWRRQEEYYRKGLERLEN